MMHVELTRLSPADIDSILALEREAFVPYLRATEATIAKRFALGHLMVGLRADGRLKGAIGFSYARFSPEDRAGFPKSFCAFSSQPVPEDANALFIYSLGLAAGLRGRRYAEMLIFEAGMMAKDLGCRYAVADVRIASYNGSLEHPQERIRQKPALRAAIDRHLAGGAFPSRKELLSDPTAALYYRMTRCEFLWVIPDFIREDRGAGGHRVILLKDLVRWEPPAWFTRQLQPLVQSCR